MKLLAAIVLAVSVLSSGSVGKTPSGNFELLLLHNNDMHGRFDQTSQLSGTCTSADRAASKCYGGFPRVAYVVKEARKAAQSGEGPPVLYLNAGDTYTGTAWFAIYKWKIAAEFVNALRPDAVSLGNHEFDEPVDTGLAPFIRNLSSPVLAANINVDNEPSLKAQTNLHKSIILTVNNVKIGIIGYLTPDTKITARKHNVEYEEEIRAIRREVKKMKKKNVNIFIALGHSGYPKDKKIAELVEDIDIVVGGHTHSLLWNQSIVLNEPEDPKGPYPTVVKQANGRIVPVVQAYAFTKYLGRLHLVFDRKGEMIHYDGNPLILNQQIPKDPEVLKIVRKYYADVGSIEKRIVGTSLVLLHGGRECRLWECNLGNIITDAVLNYTHAVHHNDYSDVTLAIVQGGRIRTSLPYSDIPFNITKGDLLQILPFPDSLSMVTMNGAVLRQCLEHSVSFWSVVNKTSGRFLQMSGMKVTFDLAKPVGARVVKASAVCSKCGNKRRTIKDEYEYKVMMPSYMSDGGDGFTMLKDLPKVTVPYSEADALEYYLKHYSPVITLTEGRVKVLNHEKADNIGFMKANDNPHGFDFYDRMIGLAKEFILNLF